MKNTKKIIISLAISLMVFVVIEIVSNNIVKDNMAEVYVATSDIYKGEKIVHGSIKKIKVQNSKNINKYSDVQITNKIAKCNIVAGKILEKNDITEEKTEDEIGYEYITLEIKNVSNAVAYQLKKGDNICVYYTTVENNIKNISVDSDVQNSVGDNKTIRVFNNVKVIGIYDSSGNEVGCGEQYNAVMLRVTAQEAMLVSNIKIDGEFNISLLK